MYAINKITEQQQNSIIQCIKRVTLKSEKNMTALKAHFYDDTINIFMTPFSPSLKEK